MRTAAFVIMMLLTTALSSTMAMSVREAMVGTERLRGSLMTSHEAINGEQMVPEMSHGADFASESKGLEAGQSGINTEDSDNEWVTMKCLSKAFCNEKKVICSKICKENDGAAETQHLPEKCFFKCKKCIPTC